MHNSLFFDQVEQHFRYLVDEYGFSVICRERYESFDNAEVIIQSRDCRIRILREKGQVFVDAAPLPPSEDWFDLTEITAYLSQGADSWKYETPDRGDYDSRIEWQVKRLADILRSYLPQICELFRKGIFEQKLAKLLEFRNQQFKERWGQYVRKN